MIQENRKSHRRPISRFAKIQVGGGTFPRDCLVTNISDGGVRLHVEGLDVPEAFVLVLDDGRGERPRGCKVVWRLGYELGAKFTDVLGPDFQPKARAAAAV
jgi:hypothetical protein